MYFPPKKKKKRVLNVDTFLLVVRARIVALEVNSKGEGRREKPVLPCISKNFMELSTIFYNFPLLVHNAFLDLYTLRQEV